MSITFVGSSSAQNAIQEIPVPGFGYPSWYYEWRSEGDDPATIEVNKPAGVQNGDFLVAFTWPSQFYGEVLTPPDGWETLPAGYGAGVVGFGDIWVKYAAVDEPSSWIWSRAYPIEPAYETGVAKIAVLAYRSSSPLEFVASQHLDASGSTSGVEPSASSTPDVANFPSGFLFSSHFWVRNLYPTDTRHFVQEEIGDSGRSRLVVYLAHTYINDNRIILSGGHPDYLSSRGPGPCYVVPSTVDIPGRTVRESLYGSGLWASWSPDVILRGDIFASPSYLEVDGGTGQYMQVGDEIVASGPIPRRDVTVTQVGNFTVEPFDHRFGDLPPRDYAFLVGFATTGLSADWIASGFVYKRLVFQETVGPLWQVFLKPGS